MSNFAAMLLIEPMERCTLYILRCNPMPWDVPSQFYTWTSGKNATKGWLFASLTEGFPVRGEPDYHFRPLPRFFSPCFTAILVGIASGTTLTVSNLRFRMFPLCVFVYKEAVSCRTCLYCRGSSSCRAPWQAGSTPVVGGSSLL